MPGLCRKELCRGQREALERHWGVRRADEAHANRREDDLGRVRVQGTGRDPLGAQPQAQPRQGPIQESQQESVAIPQAEVPIPVVRVCSPAFIPP